MTEDTFQALGIFPVHIAMLLRAILAAVDFYILAEIPPPFLYRETATFQKLPPQNTAFLRTLKCVDVKHNDVIII